MEPSSQYWSRILQVLGLAGNRVKLSINSENYTYKQGVKRRG
jgi:hypothetical protein